LPMQVERSELACIRLFRVYKKTDARTV
jgi:hypothetical protein